MAACYGIYAFPPYVRLINSRFHSFYLQLPPLAPNIFSCFLNHVGAVFFFFLLLSLLSSVLHWHHEGVNTSGISFSGITVNFLDLNLSFRSSFVMIEIRQESISEEKFLWIGNSRSFMIFYFTNILWYRHCYRNLLQIVLLNVFSNFETHF